MRKGGLLSIHILMICGKMSSKYLTYKLCVFKDGETICFMNLYKKISCQQGFFFKSTFQKFQLGARITESLILFLSLPLIT